MANRMEDKDSEIKVIIGLTLAATLAFWLGQEKINLGGKSIEQEIVESLVPRNQIARVQNAPSVQNTPLYTQVYTQDHTTINEAYRGK